MRVLLGSCYGKTIISWEPHALCCECPALMDTFICVSCFSPCKVLGKAAVAFDTWVDWASQLSKLSLLDCSLCLPANFPAVEKKALINCSSCGSVVRCGVWWMLVKWRSTVEQKLPHSLRISLTKVAEIKLDVYLRKAVSILHLQREAHTSNGSRTG